MRALKGDVSGNCLRSTVVDSSKAPCDFFGPCLFEFVLILEDLAREIKRVVSSLLLNIDALPSYVIVAGASNHPELLDRAVWRRFQVHIELPPPGPADVLRWLRKFESETELSLGISDRAAREQLGELSYAELEEFCMDVQRRVVLEDPSARPSSLARAALKQWAARHHVCVGTQGGRKR